MAQTLDNTICACPLCGEELTLNLPRWQVPADLPPDCNEWARISEEFRALRSIEATAAALSISEETARRVLEFLCTEVCGCRAVTCVSCLDDYRNEL